MFLECESGCAACSGATICSLCKPGQYHSIGTQICDTGTSDLHNSASM